MVNSACCTTTTPICRYVQCISLKPQFIFFCFGPAVISCVNCQVSAIWILPSAAHFGDHLYFSSTQIIFLIFTNHISHLYNYIWHEHKSYFLYTQIIFLIYTNHVSEGRDSNTNLVMCPVCFLRRPPLPANSHLFPSTFFTNNHNPHSYTLQSQSSLYCHIITIINFIFHKRNQYSDILQSQSTFL